MTRAEIQDQLKELVKTFSTKSEVSNSLSEWLNGKCTDFDKSQIMKDLTSYSEYNSLR